MEKLDSLNQVADFHTTFGHPIVPQPAMPAAERAALRISLLREELDELEEAVHENDLVGVADALCDLQYVLSGAVLEFGMGTKFKALFDEVQRSNMSKACKTVQEAEETIAHYKAKGTDSFYEEKDGLYLVYRTGDRKTLKSVYYSEADLKSLL